MFAQPFEQFFLLIKIPSDILKETAKKHRDLRRGLKLSQANLAERSGVSLGSIKRFEQTGRISFLSLLKVAQILGRLSEFEAIFTPGPDWTEVEKLFSEKTRS